jgi:acyl-CoA thioesterase I
MLFSPIAAPHGQYPCQFFLRPSFDNHHNVVLLITVLTHHWHIVWIAVSLILTGGPAVPVRGSEAAPAATDVRNVVVLGDSLAAGYGLDPSAAFPAVLQKKINDAGWKFHVVNAGVSGDTSAGGLRRVDWLLKRPVDVLIIELGGNDGLRGLAPAALKKNLQSIIERTRQKYPTTEIMIAGMKMPANFGSYAVEFERTYGEVAKEHNVALVPFLLEGVGGRPELNLPDRIHPTAEGQKILAENVWTVLKPVLAKLAAP